MMIKFVRSRRSITACLIAIALLTLLDLWTKQLAFDHLSLPHVGPASPICAPAKDGRVYMQRLRSGAVVLIDGYLEFRYAENCGAAFGMMNEAPSHF